MRKLMALVRGVLGRERRHVNGAYGLNRRKTDPEVRARHQALERVEKVERRLAAYQRIRLP